MTLFQIVALYIALNLLLTPVLSSALAKYGSAKISCWVTAVIN